MSTEIKATIAKKQKPVGSPGNSAGAGGPPSDAPKFFGEIGAGRTIRNLKKNTAIFSQGDPADAIFCILTGAVKLSVVSNAGKEAVIAVLGTNDFFGEGCLTVQHLRMATAVAVADSSIMRVDKPAVIRALSDEPGLSEFLLAYMLRRTIRIEEDLVDITVWKAARFRPAKPMKTGTLSSGIIVLNAPLIRH